MSAITWNADDVDTLLANLRKRLLAAIEAKQAINLTAQAPTRVISKPGEKCERSEHTGAFYLSLSIEPIKGGR